MISLRGRTRALLSTARSSNILRTWRKASQPNMTWGAELGCRPRVVAVTRAALPAIGVGNAGVKQRLLARSRRCPARGEKRFDPRGNANDSERSLSRAASRGIAVRGAASRGAQKHARACTRSCLSAQRGQQASALLARSASEATLRVAPNLGSGGFQI